VTLSRKVNTVESLNMSIAQLRNTRRAWGRSIANEGTTREGEKYLILTRREENRTKHVRRLLTESADPISCGNFRMAGVCLTGRTPKMEKTRGG
jgi:hypothetical protein